MTLKTNSIITQNKMKLKKKRKKQNKRFDFLQILKSIKRTSEVIGRVPLRSMGRTIVVRVVTRSTGKGT